MKFYNRKRELKAMFSKSGYTKDLIKTVNEMGNVFLFFQDKLVLKVQR